MKIPSIEELQMGNAQQPHKLGPKIGDGKWNVVHPPLCECMMIHTVHHARWINYNQMDGIVSCDHCETEESLPCPAVRDKIHSKTVWMNVKAIARDLWNFQLKHENCPPPEKELHPEGDGWPGQCQHLLRKPDGEPEVPSRFLEEKV